MTTRAPPRYHTLRPFPPATCIARSLPILSTSPTVLSVLEQRGSDFMLAQQQRSAQRPGGSDATVSAASSALRGLSIGDTFKKQEVGSSAVPDAAGRVDGSAAGAGLSTLLRGAASGVAASGVGASAAPAGATQRHNAPMVLSASFREAPMSSWMPQATIEEDVGGEDAEDLASSDDEPLPYVRGGVATADDDDDDDDDDDAPARGGRRVPVLTNTRRAAAPALPAADDALFDFNG